MTGRAIGGAAGHNGVDIHTGRRLVLIVTLLLVLLVLGLNLLASWVILRRQELSSGNRAAQVLVIWLLPLIGAVVCLLVAAAEGPLGLHARSQDGAIWASDGAHEGNAPSADCGSDGGGSDGGGCGD